MAVSNLPVRSCLIDGEAIVCDEDGLAVFDLIRRHGALASAVHCAFDLLELDGRDLRREPLEERKRLLARLLKGQQTSIVLNEAYEEDGEIVSARLASSAAKASCRSDLVRSIAPAVLNIGSRSRTRNRQRLSERRKRIGAARICGRR
jgi:hypothetical protein